MSEQLQTKIPVWYWIVGSAALIWNLMGVGAFVAQVTMSAEALAKLTEAKQALYANQPAWAIAAFAIAVFGGAAGCVLLLLRNKLATPIFGLSLAGIIVQMTYNFFIAETMEVYGPGAAVMPAMVVVIAIALVWFSVFAKKNQWISS